MNNNKSKIEVLEQIDNDQVYDEQQGGAIEISFKDNSSNNSYPSLGNSVSLQRDSRNSQDQIEDTPQNIQRSSYQLEEEDQGVSESFSCLNSSMKEEEVMKSNLKQKLKQIKEEDQDRNEKQMKMLNQSMFSSRLGRNPLTTKEPQSPQKEQYEAINYERSFYMSGRPPILTPSVIKEKKKPQPESVKVNKEQIKVNFISKAYLLQIKQINIEVTKTSLHSIYHELFKKQIFVPRFNYERYDEWQAAKDENKYSMQCDAHMNFKVYLERYVSYLNEYCLGQIQEVFKNVEIIIQGTSEKNTKNDKFSLFNIDFNSLLENFKTFMNQSKYEILRKTLLAKIKSLKSMLKEKQMWKLNPEGELDIHQTIKLTWNDLAQIQLLRNFEQTEVYCGKQMEQSSELKFKQIWIKYREANRKEKNEFISKVDSVYI